MSPIQTMKANHPYLTTWRDIAHFFSLLTHIVKYFFTAGYNDDDECNISHFIFR